MTEPGARQVGSVANGWAIAGDNNNVAVLNVGGVGHTTVEVPKSTAEIERLLFGPATRPGPTLVGSWLRPDAGVISVEPRPEVSSLVDWCTSESGVLARLVRASGGQGKTHLAGQVCARLQEHGWLAGFVLLPPVNWRTVTLFDLNSGGMAGDRLRRQMRRIPEIVAALNAIARSDVRTLLVVDYAENAGSMVAELLDVIADARVSDRVRVLLLARTDTGWFRELAEDHPLHDWVDPQPIELQALWDGLEPARAVRIWVEAASRFADLATVNKMVVDVRRVPDKAPESRAFATTLDLYADALLAVLDSAMPTPAPVGDPVAGVLAHERRQISAGLHAAGLTLDEAQRDWALAAVALHSATDLNEGARALEMLPALVGWSQDDRLRLARRLGQLYPDPAGAELWQAPVPDRLTDAHLLGLARQAATTNQWCADLLAVCGTNDERAAQRAAIVLHRCLSTPGRHATAQARVRAGIEALIRSFAGTYVPVMTLLDPAGFAGELTAVIGDSTPLLSNAEVRRLDQLLRNLGFTAPRVGIAVAVSRRLVAETRPTGPRTAPDESDRHAGELTSLATRLGRLGKHDEGLVAIQEAVRIRRFLVGVSTAYIPGFARSLNNLSSLLGQLGRQEEGLVAIQEAIRIRRALAETDPDRYLPVLASSLNILSNLLAGLNRIDEGSAASREALAINWRLAETEPDTYLPEVAGSFVNASIRLYESKQLDKALATGEEAASLFRQLTLENRAAHLSGLAMSLNNLAIWWYECGDLERALAATEEAVAAYRDLVRFSPVAHLSHLAGLLNIRRNLLRELGRLEESLVSGEEAVAAYRQLVGFDRSKHQPGLAGALNDLLADFAELGRPAQAVTFGEEAITIVRQLVDDFPGSYKGQLARFLNNLANVLGRTGRHDDAVVASEEAVAIYRQLARAEPCIEHLLGIASSLNDYSIDLLEIGRYEDGEAAAGEAVQAYRRLDLANPADHLAGLARALHNHSILLTRLGRDEEALTAAQDSVAVNHLLASLDAEHLSHG